MISVAEALAMVLQNTPVAPTVFVSLAEAVGRVLAQDVISDIDVPPYTKSLMDGFAVQAGDVVGENTCLTVIEEIIAGSTPQQTVHSGTAARIMTGAPLPDGANAVVRLEDTDDNWASSDRAGNRSRETVETGKVTIRLPLIAPGQNVLPRAAVLSAGHTVLPAGKTLTGVDIGMIAEVAGHQVLVRALPRVAVLATGNELVDTGSALGPGQIRNSNGPMLVGLVQQSKGVAMNLGIAADEATQLRQLISRGLDCDAVLLSGGVSAGDMDLVPGVLNDLGVRQVFHKIRMRPGKPLWFGVYQRGDCPVPVFGLPGNPVSAFVCYWLFVRPALNRFSGVELSGDKLSHVNANRTTAQQFRLNSDFHHRGDRATYFPGRILFPRQTLIGDAPSVEPLAWKGSPDLLAVTQADCLIGFAAGDHQYKAGQLVDVFVLN